MLSKNLANLYKLVLSLVSFLYISLRDVAIKNIMVCSDLFQYKFLFQYKSADKTFFPIDFPSQARKSMSSWQESLVSFSPYLKWDSPGTCSRELQDKLASACKKESPGLSG